MDSIVLLLMFFLAKEIKIWVMSGSSKESLLKVYDFDSSPEAPEKGDASKLSGQEGWRGGSWKQEVM